MTEITFIKSKNSFELKVEGHSGYAEKGKDIACAGVSTLVVSLANMLEGNSFKFKIPPLVIIKEGYALICAYPQKQYYKKIEAVFETIMCGFKWLSEEFNENIKICN